MFILGLELGGGQSVQDVIIACIDCDKEHGRMSVKTPSKYM